MPASHPNVQSFQDKPPPGGYPKINVKSLNGPRGPPGWMIWLGVCTATIYGLYQIGRTNEASRLEHKEKREARMAIIAFLQAESDRRLLQAINEAQREEAEIMKNVDGWKVGESVYSKRWMPPTLGLGK